jgi:hypothetical protein
VDIEAGFISFDLKNHPRREASRDAAAARPATTLLFVKRFTSPSLVRREATRLNRVGRSDPCLGGGWGLSRKKARTRGKLRRPGRRAVQCDHCIIECSIELQLCRKSAILYCEQGKSMQTLFLYSYVSFGSPEANG